MGYLRKRIIIKFQEVEDNLYWKIPNQTSRGFTRKSDQICKGFLHTSPQKHPRFVSQIRQWSASWVRVFKVWCVLPESAWDHLPGQEGDSMTSRGIYSLDTLNSYFCVRLRMSTWLSYSGIRLHLYTYDFATGNAQGGFREAADCFSEMPTGGAFVCLNSLEIYETAFRDSES